MIKDRPMPRSHTASALATGETLVVHVDLSFAPLVPKFLANRTADVATMEWAVVAQDFDTLIKVSHSMKGVGGSFGFHRISEIAAAIEEAAKAADAAIIQQELPLLRTYLERVEVVFD
jgi:HPt (histidine-containing phosphotransfer) domain-containing protein